MKRTLLVLMCVLMVAGCNYPRDPRTLGRQPANYDPFDGRHQGAVFGGAGGTVARPVTDPLAILVRTEERQKKVLEAMLDHYERLVNDDQRLASEASEWLQTFLKDHQGIAPDNPLAIENALISMEKTRDRAMERLQKEEKEGVKRVIEDGIKKVEEQIASLKEYQTQREALQKEYDGKADTINQANERIRQWSSRHDRISNTLRWVNQTKGDADPEINLQLKSVAEILNHEHEPTRLTTMYWFADLGGADAEQVLPRLMKIASDTGESEVVRNAAQVAVEKIESNPRTSSGQ